MLAGSPYLTCVGSDTSFAPPASRMGVAQSERRSHAVVAQDPCMTAVLLVSAKDGVASAEVIIAWRRRQKPRPIIAHAPGVPPGWV